MTKASDSIPDDAHTAESSRGWMNTAAEYARGVDYYRGLVVQIGQMLGPDACTADDGTNTGEVLCAKVPELVKAKLAENERLQQALVGSITG